VMPITTLTNPDSFTVLGPLLVQTDPNSGLTGDVSVGGVYSGGQQSGVVTTLSTGNTITPGTSGGYGSLRVTAGAAVTGIILTPGTKPGQELTIIHEGAAANTITFAAAGTSNVADGVSDVITGPSARTYVWDSVTALWYPMK
jgi:hypothetical protein